MQQSDDPLYLPPEAAEELRSNTRTMERWRATGDGPEYVKVGRRVAYRKSALLAYIERQTRRHTAETGQ